MGLLFRTKRPLGLFGQGSTMRVLCIFLQIDDFQFVTGMSLIYPDSYRTISAAVFYPLPDINYFFIVLHG